MLSQQFSSLNPDSISLTLNNEENMIDIPKQESLTCGDLLSDTEHSEFFSSKKLYFIIAVNSAFSNRALMSLIQTPNAHWIHQLYLSPNAMVFSVCTGKYPFFRASLFQLLNACYLSITFKH